MEVKRPIAVRLTPFEVLHLMPPVTHESFRR